MNISIDREEKNLHIRENHFKRLKKNYNFNVTEPATNENYKHIEMHPASHEIKKNVFKVHLWINDFFLLLRGWALRLRKKLLYISVLLMLMYCCCCDCQLKPFSSQVQIHSIFNSFSFFFSMEIFRKLLIAECVYSQVTNKMMMVMMIRRNKQVNEAHAGEWS